MNKGSVFIVSGPSGSGKDTILRLLFEKRPELRFSISATTRPKREEDEAQPKYKFLTREEFEKMIADDALLEYNEYAENYYGTPKAPVIEAVSSGEDMVIEVDVNGAANIRKRIPEAISIFIMPPSFAELERRLTGRGSESREIIEKRLNSALNEIKRATEYDYIVVNDDINVAVEHINSVLLAEKLKLENQKNIINEVLKKC